MDESIAPLERIQRLTARTLATHPVGCGLCLVGGFRYRLHKLSRLSLSPAEAIARIDQLASYRTVHIRGIERLLDEQVNVSVATNLRAGGGGAMIWDAVVSRLKEVLAKAQESAP